MVNQLINFVGCRCDATYTTGNCMEGTGQCLCKPEYAGANCDR